MTLGSGRAVWWEEQVLKESGCLCRGQEENRRSIDNAQRHATIEHILPTRLHLLMFSKLAKIEPPSGNQAISMWACGGHFKLIPWHGSWEAVIHASHVSTGSLVPFSVYIVWTSPYCFSEAHSVLCQSSLQPRPLQMCCEDQWLVHWKIVNMTYTVIASLSTIGKSGGKLGRCHHDQNSQGREIGFWYNIM